MSEHLFHDQLSLEEATETMGKQAMKQGLIPSFAIHFFSDSWVFYIPSDRSQPLTPEEAYLFLQKLLES